MYQLEDIKQVKIRKLLLGQPATLITASGADINAMAGGAAAAGTVVASTAVVVDANKDIAAFRNVGLVNLDAGSSGVAGSVDIFPTTASKGKTTFVAADNTGNTTTTITTALQATTRTYTIPDAGVAAANFALEEPAQVVSVDAAITIKRGVVIITKGSAAAITLANPTATTDDFKTLQIMSTTAFAHTVSNAAGAGFNGGGAGTDVGTFGTAKGNNIVLVAYQGVWYVQSSVNVTLG